MNKLTFLILLTGLVLVGCDESDNKSADTGITTEATEKYFGFVDKKSVTYEGTQTINDNTAPATFTVTMEIDNQTLSKKTFKLTWKSTIGVQLEEWYEIKDDTVYKVAMKYIESKESKEKNIIFSTPIVFGKNPLKDGANYKTETDGSTYTYIVSTYNYKTFKNDFGEVKRIIGNEDTASNIYYLKENEGFVGFKFDNHPALFTLEIEIQK